ncbi:MAG: YgjV family protein [Clostridia bacterium]|nr:YgjV family protein [Clostridia bacterium]
MNNLLFSLPVLGETIVNGLIGSLGMVWFQILINSIGVMAILVKVVESQSKKRKIIILLAIINFLLWITYFVLNGNLTAATVNSISLVQAIIFLQREKHKWANSKFWLFLFVSAQIVASFFTWNGPFSLFSIAGGILTTIAYYVLDVKLYRYFFLALMLFWVGNGIVYFYPIALIHDVFGVISISIAIIRYNFKGEQPKQNMNDNLENN